MNREVKNALANQRQGPPSLLKDLSKNTNLVEDVEYLLLEKFLQNLCSGCGGEVQNVEFRAAIFLYESTR